MRHTIGYDMICFVTISERLFIYLLDAVLSCDVAIKQYMGKYLKFTKYSTKKLTLLNI